MQIKEGFDRGSKFLSYKTKLCKMTSHFELLTQSQKTKVTLRATNCKLKNKKLNTSSQ